MICFQLNKNALPVIQTIYIFVFLFWSEICIFLLSSSYLINITSKSFAHDFWCYCGSVRLCFTFIVYYGKVIKSLNSDIDIRNLLDWLLSRTLSTWLVALWLSSILFFGSYFSCDLTAPFKNLISWGSLLITVTSKWLR